MKDFYSEYIKKQSNRNKLEKKLDEVNHQMELVRTVVPVLVLILQIIIVILLEMSLQ